MILKFCDILKRPLSKCSIIIIHAKKNQTERIGIVRKVKYKFSKEMIIELTSNERIISLPYFRDVILCYNI